MQATERALGGRFRLDREAGAGAFGQVFEATDLQTGSKVAIKYLKAHLSEPTILERFEREARLLESIQHPQIVGFVAYGVEDERPYLALEWLPGEDLGERQRRAPLALPEAVRIVAQAALGLQALHERGIVHRDIKPSNFFLVQSPEGPSLKLIDLGVARVREDLMLTSAGLRIGTPAYMSPEQAAGDEQVDASSDLFSLGVVLFELCTGRRPHSARDPLALLAKIVLDQPPRLRDFDPDLPEELDALTSEMLAKVSADRPASAASIAERLGSMTLPNRQTAVGRDEVQTEPEAMERGSRESMVERRVVTTLFVATPRDEASAASDVERIGRSFGGDVRRLLGRRMVVVFGSTKSIGDEALRAARAALVMQGSIDGVRLAIATGRATGDRNSTSGQVIDRGAADLERAKGAIVVDEPTARRLSTHFILDEEGESRHLRTERPVSTVAEPRLLGRDTEMLDRDRELEELEDLYHDAVRQSRPTAGIVKGLAGMGKSRLRFELTQRLSAAHPAPNLVLLRCDPTLTGVPFGALTHSLRRKLRIGSDLEAPAQHEQLRRWAKRRGMRSDLDFIAELLRIPNDASPALEAARADPTALAGALRDALVQLISALGQEDPVALLIEDIQWADPSTVDGLAWVLDTLVERPIYVAAFGRPGLEERFPDIWSALRPLHLELRPLSNRACEKIARELLAGGGSEEQIREISTRAGGNPLFLEELIRAASAGEDDLPVAIQAAFQVRLDALPPPAKRTALAASVFGRAVWADALRALVPRQDSELSADVLCHWEVLADRPRSRFPGTRELVFRHGLLQDVAYAMLTNEDRAEFHGRAARWLEKAGERDAAVLAHHYSAAGDTQLAAHHSLVAAREALREGALVTAMSHAGRTLENAIPTPEKAELHHIAALACHRLGRYEDSLRHSSHGLSFATEPVLRAELAATRVLTLRRTGAMDASAQAAEQALGEATERSRSEALDLATAHLEAELGWTLYNVGTQDRAMELADHLCRVLDRSAPKLTALVTSALHLRARLLHSAGRLDESLAAHRDVVQLAHDRGHYWRSEGARHGLGQVLVALGCFEEAIKELRRTSEQGRSLRMPSTEGYAQLYLGL
ncbi:MAG: protein kinase, partial [Myxococcales bacterium]|nr:protein kinase [Myxococcales bacterium]